MRIEISSEEANSLIEKANEREKNKCCGYKFWIEENKRQRRLYGSLFYVCYSEVEEVEVHDDSGIASNCRSYPINIDNCY